VPSYVTEKKYMLVNVITTNMIFSALQCNGGFVKCTRCFWVIEYTDDFIGRPDFICVNTRTKDK